MLHAGVLLSSMRNMVVEYAWLVDISNVSSRSLSSSSSLSYCYYRHEKPSIVLYTSVAEAQQVP